MDNILDKFGLYDFFGLLIPGMYFFIILDFLNFPQAFGIQYPTNEGILVVTFLLFSYLIGTFIQEIATYIDKKVKLRDMPKRKFLNGANKIFSEKEHKEVQVFVKEQFGNIDYMNKDENEMIFKKMKACIENEDKMEKADKFDAIYAMSRDMIVCNISLLIIAFINIFINVNYIHISVIVCLFNTISIVIFWHRACEYTKKRVRTIIRQYISLKETSNS